MLVGRLRLKRAAGILLLASVMSSAAIQYGAAETVRFPTATTPPTALQERLARERGQAFVPPPTTDLTGELYYPAGAGPYPAVVMLHGCAGRSSRTREDAGGAYFASLGYALLIVDSFGPRGITDRCGTSGSPADRVIDAFGALLYLAGLPFIDAERIAVVGYSQGGGVALSSVKLDGFRTLFERQFRAAVAYYPPCEVSMGGVEAGTAARDALRIVAP